MTTRALASAIDVVAGGLPVRVQWTTGLLTLFFSERFVSDYEAARDCDTQAYAVFCRAMLDRGVYLPPSQFEAWFPSLAHSEAHVERTVEAVGDALRETFR